MQPAEEQGIIPENSENIDLVDLVDQPAWKTILIELVKSEKMNPWDIDIIGLANRYLVKIQAMEKTDLKLPANAILASAILLKLKARAIRISSIEEEDELTEQISEKEIQFLEENLPELRHGRQSRQGKITLDQLVSNIESILERTKNKKNIFREKDIPDFKVVINEKDIEARIETVMQKINERLDSRGIARFSQLPETQTPKEMIYFFLPMLFLANKQKIRIWQDIFWEEIFIALAGENEQEQKV